MDISIELGDEIWVMSNTHFWLVEPWFWRWDDVNCFMTPLRILICLKCRFLRWLINRYSLQLPYRLETIIKHKNPAEKNRWPLPLPLDLCIKKALFMYVQCTTYMYVAWVRLGCQLISHQICRQLLNVIYLVKSKYFRFKK